MKRPRSVMLVTQAFPPEAVVGAHRMMALCRHLVEQNYEVSVITSHPPQDAAVDESLTEMIPAELKVISTAGVDLPLLAARILKPQFLKKLRGKKSEPLPSEPKESQGKKQTGPGGCIFRTGVPAGRRRRWLPVCTGQSEAVPR